MKTTRVFKACIILWFKKTFFMKNFVTQKFSFYFIKNSLLFNKLYKIQLNESN